MGIISDIAADSTRCPTTERRSTYPKLHYNGEDYVDAIFVNGEFRYGWLPSTKNMRNQIALQQRQMMRVIEGRRFERKNN